MASIPVPTSTNKVFVFVTLGENVQKHAELLEPVGDKDQVLIKWSLSGFEATVDVSKISFDDPSVRGGRRRQRKTTASVAAPAPAPANKTHKRSLNSNNKKKPPKSLPAASAPPAATAKTKAAKKTTTITTGRPNNKRPPPRVAAAATATAASGYSMTRKEERALKSKTSEDVETFKFTGEKRLRRKCDAWIAYRKGDMNAVRAALAHDFERFLRGDDPKATFEDASRNWEDEMDVLMEEPNSAAPSRRHGIAGGRNKKMSFKKTARSATSANANATFEGDSSDSDDTEVLMEQQRQFPTRNDRSRKTSKESAATLQPKRSRATADDDTQNPSPSKKLRVTVDSTTVADPEDPMAPSEIPFGATAKEIAPSASALSVTQIVSGKQHVASLKPSLKSTDDTSNDTSKSLDLPTAEDEDEAPYTPKTPHYRDDGKQNSSSRPSRQHADSSAAMAATTTALVSKKGLQENSAAPASSVQVAAPPPSFKSAAAASSSVTRALEVSTNKLPNKQLLASQGTSSTLAISEASQKKASGATDFAASPEGGGIDLTSSPEGGGIDFAASPEGGGEIDFAEGGGIDLTSSPEEGGDIDFVDTPEGAKPASSPSSDPAINLWGEAESNIGEIPMPLDLEGTISDTVYAPKASSTTAETGDLDKKLASESTPRKVSMQDDGDRQGKPRNPSPGVSSWEDELIKAPLGNIENQMIPEREVPLQETTKDSRKAPVYKTASTSNIGVGSLPEKELALAEDSMEQQEKESRTGQSTGEAFRGFTSESGSESSDDDDKTIPFSMAGLNDLDKSINSDIYKSEKSTQQNHDSIPKEISLDLGLGVYYAELPKIPPSGASISNEIEMLTATLANSSLSPRMNVDGNIENVSKTTIQDSAIEPQQGPKKSSEEAEDTCDRQPDSTRKSDVSDSLYKDASSHVEERDDVDDGKQDSTHTLLSKAADGDSGFPSSNRSSSHAMQVLELMKAHDKSPSHLEVSNDRDSPVQPTNGSPDRKEVSCPYKKTLNFGSEDEKEGDSDKAADTSETIQDKTNIPSEQTMALAIQSKPTASSEQEKTTCISDSDPPRNAQGNALSGAVANDQRPIEVGVSVLNNLSEKNESPFEKTSEQGTQSLERPEEQTDADSIKIPLKLVRKADLDKPVSMVNSVTANASKDDEDHDSSHVKKKVRFSEETLDKEAKEIASSKALVTSHGKRSDENGDLKTSDSFNEANIDSDRDGVPFETNGSSVIQNGSKTKKPSSNHRSASPPTKIPKAPTQKPKADPPLEKKARRRKVPRQLRTNDTEEQAETPGSIPDSSTTGFDRNDATVSFSPFASPGSQAEVVKMSGTLASEAASLQEQDSATHNPEARTADRDAVDNTASAKSRPGRKTFNSAGNVNSSLLANEKFSCSKKSMKAPPSASNSTKNASTKSRSKKSVLAQSHPPAFSFDTRTVRHGGINTASTNNFTNDQIESWITKCATCLLTYESKWKGDQSLSYYFGPKVVSEVSKTHGIPIETLKKAIMEQGRWPQVFQAAMRMKTDNDIVALASSASTKDRLNKKRALKANEESNVRPTKKPYRVLGGLLNKMSSGQSLEDTTAPSNRKVVEHMPKKIAPQPKSIPPTCQRAAVASQSRGSVLPCNVQRVEESTGVFQMRTKDKRAPKKRWIARMEEEESRSVLPCNVQCAEESTGDVQMRTKDKRAPKKRWIARMKEEEESKAESMTEAETPVMDSYLPMSPIVGRGRNQSPSYLPIMSPETIRDPTVAPSTQVQQQRNMPPSDAPKSFPAKPKTKLPLTESARNAVDDGKASAQEGAHFGKRGQSVGKNKKNGSSKTAEATAPALSTMGGHIDYFDELFG